MAGFGEEGGWVGGEDSGCGCGGRGGRVGDGAEVRTAFVEGDGGFVVEVDDGGAGHGTEELGEGVQGEVGPGEVAEETGGEGYGGVEV